MRSELEALIKGIFYKDWMDDSDWIEFQDFFFAKTGSSYELMEDQINIGIKNGYSKEFQFKLLKQLFKSQQ